MSTERVSLLPPGLRWKDVDGKELMFLNDRRPARRFLYFRFLMTHLICKHRNEAMDWFERTETGGAMWASTGQYLRSSMLSALAKQAGHQSLPNGLVCEKTFSQTPDNPRRSNDKETLLAQALRLKLLGHENELKELARGDSESSDDER
ncbi:MAG: hypothetical protein M1825_001234 [Sarcosagium campestre]|nr:MAG: hypothetical protein M1825_001234 [Sarcosagium campestre]